MNNFFTKVAESVLQTFLTAERFLYLSNGFLQIQPFIGPANCGDDVYNYNPRDFDA